MPKGAGVYMGWPRGLIIGICSCGYAKAILGVQIDQLTISHTNANLRVALQSRVIPSSILGQNTSQQIPLAWNTPTNPLAI